MNERGPNILTVSPDGGRARELLLPAGAVNGSALSPDGFDLAVATDAGVFVLDALDADPPEIVLHPLPIRLAVGDLDGAEDANACDPADLVDCGFTEDGHLRLTDRDGAEHLLDLREAALQQLTRPAFIGGFWRIGRPVSDLVYEGYRKGYRISREMWDFAVEDLLKHGEESTCETITDLRCNAFADCDFDCDACGSKKVARRMVERMKADINFVLRRLPVRFEAEEVEDYPAPALRVTFRPGAEWIEMLVVPHLNDSVEKLRAVFEKEEPYWMHRGEPRCICWEEYDMGKPDRDYMGRLADSCFQDPYCDKPSLHHDWAFQFTHGEMLGVTLKSDRLPEPYHGEFPYRDFRFAVLYGLGKMARSYDYQPNRS